MDNKKVIDTQLRIIRNQKIRIRRLRKENTELKADLQAISELENDS